MRNFTFKKWNTFLGWLSFCIALAVYSLTVEPTLSFWDCGEYISTSAKLEVGHPPGAPLFQMAGAFFAMFASGPDKIALMVNMLSVFCSAFTILFMFWASTLLLNNMLGTTSPGSKNNPVMVLASSFVGCMAFTFSDSFWYSAVEAEVYAMASLFIAILLWAGLKWGEEMHRPRGNRWLLLISLLIGLSFGVHFMALLAIPSIGLIYYFKNYQNVTVKNFIIANIIIVALLFLIFKFLLPLTLSLFASAELFMVNSLNMPFNSGTIFIASALIAVFYFGLRYTHKKQLPAFNTMLLCLLFIFIGFSSWMMLPIRANANVVINENRPSDATEVLAYYNREQYGGEQKTFYGPAYTEVYAGLDKENPYTDATPNYERDYKTGRYVVVNNFKNALQNPDKAHSGFFQRMSSDLTAVNYMAFNGPPEFKLDPAYDYSRELQNYGVDINTLTDEEALQATAQVKAEMEKIVGDFKTAYQTGQAGNEELDKFLHAYQQFLIIKKPTFTENIKFMFDYQFGYMYWRYLMWNFAGRQNDVQGEYDNRNGNWLSGINAIDEARLGPQTALTDDMLNNKARNIYFMLPFLIGVVGFIYHARKNLRSFYVMLALFLFTSFALKIFLNERPFEPRERDYAVVASFYVFALWIGFGVYALYEVARKYLRPQYASTLVIGMALLAGPVLMGYENWDDHDRSGKYTALSMAKSYLDSCGPNAILFTVGDNDTFPLWYAQEIEGYRTDVRVVCSTFLPKDWYIDMLKKQAYNSAPMPISLSHSQYVEGTRDYMVHNPATKERITLDQLIGFIVSEDERTKVTFDSGQKISTYPSNKIRIPVDKQQVIKNKAVSPQRYDTIVPYIDIDLPESAIYKSSLIMLDIVRNNNWERPVYFTGGSIKDEDYIWMKDYLQLDGLAYRLVPVKTPVDKNDPIDMGYIDTGKMYDIVMRWDWGNSGSPHIYHDEETRRNSFAFRRNMGRLTEALLKEGKIEKAKTIIDTAMRNMPPEKFGIYALAEPFADGYYKTGQKKKARKLLTLLTGKYQDSLKYYKSLPVKEQEKVFYDIVGDIERYRNLLIVMQDNNDNAMYKASKDKFNSYNALFDRFKREYE